ncbi:biotin-dependent carboxyltransferase family protein (plasmid) [Rhizobium sp. 32-5/1]|uniref:5-oxoprolinase subunit C family protein n=1 Tax=Rhizobium sp. 32-5/1 TaxID=3019602 RepID=UPI00240D3976|nr:biotin-dependent carboxyltransferase family protein [Rhizobium sp. 32-5/1]WEZ85475.1 biotin-dependent carboxyltransferase family protein [Rhizobium sp. 32-5/1]
MIEILSSGATNTIQDGGRRGHLDIGVSMGGAMDISAFGAANALLGNPADAAVIEVSMFPFRLRFHRDTNVAVTGADCMPAVEGRIMPPCWAWEAKQGEILVLSPPTSGARAYVAFGGGIDVPKVLGSRSTDLKAGFGGWEGRGLMRGDKLSLVPVDVKRIRGLGYGGLPYGEEKLPLVHPDSVAEVRAIPAAEYDSFSLGTREAFWQEVWTVTKDANRMGYRLSGATLRPKSTLELLSHGIVPGTIQIPPSGQPIIQLADANTCGGYPKMATVIQADLWKLAQMPVGGKLRFQECDVVSAIDALRIAKEFPNRLASALSYLAG